MPAQDDQQPATEPPEWPEWPEPADCPDCACHTQRTCVAGMWHRGRPELSDGGPWRDDMCPCYAAATPEPLTLTVTLGGEVRSVPAVLHRRDVARGLAELSGLPCTAQTRDGRRGPVTMFLARLADGLDYGDEFDHAHPAADGTGRRWVAHLVSDLDGDRARIVSWWP
ncbi:hypothetical protein [Kitasatospora sp. LaBMicrA B282]|uniref:hypothetical protein n=1 Tax=Kitasatospora sp. LaBMicrA B282 TaxID=3420949 RepID=UPI003D0C54D1